MIIPWVLLTLVPAGLGADPLGGTWRQIDIRSLENGRHPETGTPCQRIWLEQRDYEFNETSDPQREGIYGNYLQAVPMGSITDCRFAEPAPEPLASHTRTWRVVAKRVDATTWQVNAEIGTNVGPFDLETPSFSTTLRIQGDRLSDERPQEPLTFRRSADRSEARGALEARIRQLYTGRCEQVYRETELARGGAARIEQMCDLVERAKSFTGRFQSLVVEITSPFDAVPKDFPDPSSSSWVDRSGAVFQYKIVFEQQELYGSSIVWEQGGEWRLAYIW